MPIKLLHVRSGACCTIYALAYPTAEITPDPCPALSFLSEQAANPKELLKLTALLTRVAQHGKPEDESKFRPLGGSDNLYEFKTSGGLRLLCFWDGNHIVICTHGVPKLAKKKFKSEMKAAENSRVDYFNAKSEKKLLYGPKPKQRLK
jgi:hypothetical protein